MSAILAVLVTMLAQALRTGVTYACAALGGVWSERSGVVNVALEGLLLASGLAAIVAHRATGSPWAGAAAGVGVAAALAAVHALLVVHLHVDAIVSGLALNLLAAGGTTVVHRAVDGPASSAVAGFHIAALDGRSGAMVLLRAIVDPLTLATAALLAVTVFIMYSTRFGLRVRASGEEPAGAASVGVPVERLRIAAVVIGGAICGVGGVALAYDQHQFQPGMSGGRGFVALAIVVIAGWRPGRAVVACAFFAVLDALQVVFHDSARIPHEVVEMLPYVVSLIALAVVAGRVGTQGRPPAGLGKAAR